MQGFYAEQDVKNQPVKFETITLFPGNTCQYNDNTCIAYINNETKFMHDAFYIV